MILVSTLRWLLVMPCKSYAHLGVTLRTRRYWFLKRSTLRELLAMPCKIVRPPSSTQQYWFLKQSTLSILCKIVRPPSSNPAYPAILILDAINPERAISYAMQNRTPIKQYPAILIPEASAKKKVRLDAPPSVQTYEIALCAPCVRTPPLQLTTFITHDQYLLHHIEEKCRIAS